MGHDGNALLFAGPQGLSEALHTLGKQVCTAPCHLSMVQTSQVPVIQREQWGRSTVTRDLPRLWRDCKDRYNAEQSLRMQNPPEDSGQTALGLLASSVVHQTSSRPEKSCPGQLSSRSALQHVQPLKQSPEYDALATEWKHKPTQASRACTWQCQRPRRARSSPWRAAPRLEDS